MFILLLCDLPNFLRKSEEKRICLTSSYIIAQRELEWNDAIGCESKYVILC